MTRFTAKATNVLNKSLYLASELGHTYIGSEHILLALTSEADSVAAKLLEHRGITFDRVRSLLTKKVGVGERTRITPNDMTPRTKRIIESSAHQAARFSQSYIGTEHLLLALAGETDSVAAGLLTALGTTPSDIAADVVSFFEDLGTGTTKDKHSIKHGSVSDAPTLSQYGRDLTALAREGKLDCVIGRDKETERVIQILSRRTKNNPCLIGEPGVGKTAVVEGLAIRIAEGAVPETLAGKLILTLDLPSMIAGAKYRGEFEERMKAVMAEAAKNPAVILFIDEIHTLIGAGAAEGAVDAANILKPALARGELQLIGATTTAEYRKHIERDAALERRFGAVTVGEPTPDEAVAILHGLRDRYESHHKIKITDEAIDAAVKLSVRYIGDRYLPDKAIDLIDEAASRARIVSFTSPPDLARTKEEISSVRADKEEAVKSQDYEKAASLRDKEKVLRTELEKRQNEWKNSFAGNCLSIGADEIAEIVTSWTGIPVKKLENEEGERLTKLSALLKERVIGQDEAADAVADALRRGRVGLKDPDRPTGSFIFLGPTGVGKTELCRVLADIMFGDKNAMIRIDMSELMDRHSTSKLIGSPPGYVGYGEGGRLTEAIRKKPYSVVLFDEIEKAHPDVFNLLLQILEDGILTDSEGRRADFKNAIIIMTSNLGAHHLTENKRPLGFSVSENSDAKNAVLSELRKTFRPEFLNRVDEVIIFNKLNMRDIKQICKLMLSEVRERAEKLGIDVVFGDDVAEFIAREGYDPLYGARPLRRVIRSTVEDSLTAAILERGDTMRKNRLTAFVNTDRKIDFMPADSHRLDKNSP